MEGNFTETCMKDYFP